MPDEIKLTLEGETAQMPTLTLEGAETPALNLEGTQPKERGPGGPRRELPFPGRAESGGRLRPED